MCSIIAFLRVWSAEPWSDIFIIILISYFSLLPRFFFFLSYVDLCIGNAKEVVGKTDSLAQINAVSPNCNSIVFFTAIQERNQFHLRMFYVEKNPNFIKSSPLSVYLFSILCDAVRSMHRAHLLHTEEWWLSWGKVLILLFELWAVLTFLWSTIFLEGTAYLGIGQRFSWKWSKYDCHLRENN